MKYKIIPKNNDEIIIDAENASEAIIEFATEMDSDMSLYFKAVKEDENGDDIVTKELPATIIDIFEDFLDEKNVAIINDDEKEEIERNKENYPSDTSDIAIKRDLCLANIYGEDFDYLMSKIMETLKNFGINVENSYEIREKEDEKAEKVEELFNSK